MKESLSEERRKICHIAPAAAVHPTGHSVTRLRDNSQLCSGKTCVNFVGNNLAALQLPGGLVSFVHDMEG